jgi:phenylalanine-4-hydroxylase
VPDDVFFDHLANRRFPAGAFIRPEEELDYLQEPDVFHDIFGHVPLLANSVFADFMVAYGKGGQRAMQLGQLANLARLYWYTVEFGLIRTPAGLRIFGAGILSSVAECEFALESSSPNRVAFDLERVMRTKYAIDDFQQTYFVFESFEDLLAACYQDFGTVYERLAAATDIEPFELIEGDEVLTRGTLAHFKNDQHSPPAPSDLCSIAISARSDLRAGTPATSLPNAYFERTNCNAVIYFIDDSAETFVERDHPLFVGRVAPGPGTAPRHLG